MAFCSKCGAQINDGAQFCPKCGQPNNAVSQQQANQQQYVAQPQEKEHGRMYKMWHSKWNWIAAITFLIVIIAANTCNSSTSNIEQTTKEIMVEKFKKEGMNLEVKSLNLVHKSGNEYTGLAECKVDGEDAQFSLKVISDGQTVQAEWELSEVGNSDVVDSFNNDDVAQVGYKAGYEMGFQLGGDEYINENDNIQMIYTNYYSAPSTPEEKKQYDVFAENYKKGFRDGRNAR